MVPEDCRVSGLGSDELAIGTHRHAGERLGHLEDLNGLAVCSFPNMRSAIVGAGGNICHPHLSSDCQFPSYVL